MAVRLLVTKDIKVFPPHHAKFRVNSNPVKVLHTQTITFFL